MILYKNKKNIALSIFFILLFCECKKPEESISPEIYYVSSGGYVIKHSIYDDYEITIPANALLTNQYIKERYDRESPKLVLDSTVSFGAISNAISFACYNCNALQIPGTMKLGFARGFGYNYDSYYNLPKTKPYCIKNNLSILDFNNWEEIPTFSTSLDKKITFKFTDLNKTYFIGWRSN